MSFPVSQTLELTNTDFEKISQLVYNQCGIHLSEGKRELVKARLGKRMRSGSFRSFRDYYHHVIEDASGEELVFLLDSISTNFTFFFREPKHFQYLQKEFLPEWTDPKKNRGGKLRLWSAGCSSGEEPYSLAMSLLEAIGARSHWEISILATDLSTKVLQAAEAGIFPKEKVQSIPPDQMKKYFLKGEDQWKDYVKVKDFVRQRIQFKRLNLMEPFSFQESFDCIFCRNVMIYFDKKTQADLVGRFHVCLKRGGFLVIGHSESLTGIHHPFTYVKPTVYKKD